MSRKIQKLFKRYIKWTDKSALVENAKVFAGTLPFFKIEEFSGAQSSVLISSKVLKHTYDKRPAQEFDFFLKNLGVIIKLPNLIYKNKSGKRGSFCLVKEIRGVKYLCVIEKAPVGFEVVTFFKVEDSYLDNYELLWEWKDGTPSS